MAIKKVLYQESTSGILLIIATLLALIFSNSALAPLYDALLTTPFIIQLGEFALHKPLLLWINDGLMALFFLYVGLEIKREIVQGELSTKSQAALPIIAALGGIILPAILYYAVNYENPEALRGWAIPVATDIAFAVGILALLGNRVPKQIKVLLLSLAIIDDLAAIGIIAFFYTEHLSLSAVCLSLIGFLGAILLNRAKVTNIAPYILIGIFMWVCVLKSGIHATLAGVFLALTIPLESKKEGQSPLKDLENSLKPWVVLLIMPIFAFANAGVSFKGLEFRMLLDPIPLGIILGLFVGKQLGVFTAIFAGIKLGLCKMPANVSWSQIYGLAIITGIGFTMSLFIGTLAFNDPFYLAEIRIGVLLASVLSAVIGYTVLRLISKNET